MNDLKKLINGYVTSEGITKDEFAERLGIGRSALYMKQSGNSPWTLNEAVALSKLLGLSIDDLVKLAL